MSGNWAYKVCVSQICYSCKSSKNVSLGNIFQKDVKMENYKTQKIKLI